MISCINCFSKKVNKLKFINTNILISSDFKKKLYKPNLLLCSKCGNIFKEMNTDYLSELNLLYKNYSSFDQFNEVDQIKFTKNKNKEISLNRCDILVKLISKYIDNKKKLNFLDFGTGNGAMIFALSKYFKNVKLNAMDVNNKKINKFKKIKNFNNFYNFKKLLESKEKYDVITLIHVLEHSLNPIEDLKLLNSKLNDRGLLMIQVPNIEENPFDLIVFDHITHFNSSSIKFLLNSCGFEIIKFSNNIIASELTLICKKNETKIDKKNHINKEKFHQLINIHKKNLRFLDFYFKLSLKKYSNRIAIFGTAISGVWMSLILRKKFIFLDDNKLRQGKIIHKSKIYNPSVILEKNNYKIILPFSYKKIKMILSKYPYEKYIYAKF